MKNHYSCTYVWNEDYRIFLKLSFKKIFQTLKSVACKFVLNSNDGSLQIRQNYILKGEIELQDKKGQMHDRKKHFPDRINNSQ